MTATGQPMTNEERARFDAMEKQINDIHNALFKPQIGEKVSMLEKLAQLVDVSEKGTWVVSWVVKVVLSVGAIVVAVSSIKSTGIFK